LNASPGASARAARLERLFHLLERRILLLDGAMGTRLQRLALDEQDFRGARFLDSDRPQRGNYDILTLTQPQLVAAVHREYLEAGADVIRTNTFLANAPSQSPFGMAHVVHELNLEAARLARSIADAHEEESGRAVFVAGVVGPTDRAVSLTKGTDTADARGVSFDELVRAHADAVRGLMHGGADLILIETVFDAANARAALEAARKVFIELGYELPLAVSLTPCDDDGRIRSGETPGEVWEAIRDAKPLIVGLNCGSSPRALIACVPELARVAEDAFVCVYPSAGLPDAAGNYPATPHDLAEEMRALAARGVINIAGGCCGTTPGHIRALRAALSGEPGGTAMLSSRGACGIRAARGRRCRRDPASDPGSTAGGI